MRTVFGFNRPSASAKNASTSWRTVGLSGFGVGFGFGPFTINLCHASCACFLFPAPLTPSDTLRPSRVAYQVSFDRRYHGPSTCRAIAGSPGGAVDSLPRFTALQRRGIAKWLE